MTNYKAAQQLIEDKLDLWREQYRLTGKNPTSWWNNLVKIVHDDCSTMQFANSYCEEVEVNGELWLIVFTEHQGNHCFSCDELLEYSYWQRKDILQNKMKMNHYKEEKND